MGRYRSSFEDLAGAIAAAAAIKPGTGEEGKKHTHYPGVALVSFDSPPESPGESASESSEESAPESSETPTLPPAPSVPRAVEPASSHFDDIASTAEGISRRPPKLPELTDITDHVVRCEKIIAWIVEAIGASEVFIADGAGQHVAGVIPGAEERIARAGEAVAAIARLSGAAFGHGVSIFELHLGEGPFWLSGRGEVVLRRSASRRAAHASSGARDSARVQARARRVLREPSRGCVRRRGAHGARRADHRARRARRACCARRARSRGG